MEDAKKRTITLHHITLRSNVDQDIIVSLFTKPENLTVYPFLNSCLGPTKGQVTKNK